MMWNLQLGVLLLLLSNGEGLERRILRKPMLRRTHVQGVISNETHQTSNLHTDVDAGSVSVLAVNPRASHVGNSHERMQGNHTRRPGPYRRLPPNRRVPQPRIPLSQGSTFQDPSNKPDPSRTQSGQTRPLLGSASSLSVLASFAGKNRILIISAPHQSDGYYRLMMSLLKPDVYCEMAERHMQQIVMFHQKDEAGGKVRRVSNQGQIREEPLDPALVPRLMNFLKLEEGKFTMVLLRKNLQVEERYPYPVRLEAVYEVLDQTPIRKLEKVRQRGFVQRCRAAGVEGQVVESQGTVTTDSEGQEKEVMVGTPRKETERFAPQPPTQVAVVVTTHTGRQAMTMTTRKPTTTRPTTTTTSQTTTQKATTTKPTTTQTPATTTTTAPTTTTTTKPTTTSTTRRTTTTTKPTTTVSFTSPTLTLLHSTATPWDQDSSKEQNRDETDHKPDQKVATGSITDENSEKVELESDAHINPGDVKPIDGDAVLEPTSSKREKARNENTGGRKKTNKAARKNKADKKKTKTVTDSISTPPGRKSGKKAILNQGKKDSDGPLAKQPTPASPLTSFFGRFEKRRRLLVISTPSEDNRMYTQQRDEYLENVCEMAIRKVSIITIFGSWNNGTMKIDHYQLENDQPLKGAPKEDLTDQSLIKALRKELGLTFNDYYMVLTDFDMKVKQEYEVPIAMKAVSDYIDTFPSRITEMEQQKKKGLTCKREDKSRTLENFLSRFRWRRRLFVISAPDEEEYSYQQQLYSMNSQACNLGLRHMSVLKLVGKEAEYMSGVLELYPINGSSSVEREDLSASLVRDVRNYFQISPEYFSMLLVGKDGNVKSWYPSPMWSMSIIYDLVDSMQLRRQEMAIQQSLGMRCPDDDYGHGYHEQDSDGYHHRGYGY